MRWGADPFAVFAKGWEALYDTGQRCVGRGETFSKTEEDYLDKITDFYQSFPADRQVQVGKILEGLCDERRLTLQQMPWFPPLQRAQGWGTLS